MYLVCYKILISLAYPCFSCYYINCDKCIFYTSRWKCMFWNTL